MQARIPSPRSSATLRAGRAGMHGFTLIEVMVAIALMAVMAAVSWRGIDGLLRAQAYTQRNATEQAVLQTSLMQWQTDLEQMSNILSLTPLEWDGKALRITRASARQSAADAPSVVVVAWSERLLNGQRYWLRWQSTPIVNREQWREAWASAQLWSQGQGGNTRGQETALVPITDWRLFYARDGRWTNPLSSGETEPDSDTDSGSGNSDGTTTGPQYTTSSAFFTLPEAVRLEVDLAPNQVISGRITRDWLLPTYGKTR